MFICKTIEATMASWVFNKISQNTKCNHGSSRTVCHEAKRLDMIQKICCKTVNDSVPILGLNVFVSKMQSDIQNSDSRVPVTYLFFCSQLLGYNKKNLAV